MAEPYPQAARQKIAALRKQVTELLAEQKRWRSIARRMSARAKALELERDEALDACVWFSGFDVAEQALDAYRAHRATRACRECGCTDAFGCDGGCSWVEEDLCSACADGSA